MAETQLPTADQFFGSQLPTADEFFNKPYRTLPNVVGTTPGVGYTGDVPASSPEIDEFLRASKTGHVLSAFGQGFEQGWGSEPLGLSPESEEQLRKAGVFNDYLKGHFSATKAVNEAWMRPAAVALDTLLRGSTAAFTGAQGAVAQIGEEMGQPQLGRDIAAMPEAFFGSPHPVGIPKPVDLAKARSLGVIGEGEEGWKGTAQPNVEARFAAENEAIKAQVEAQTKAQEAKGAPETPAPVETAPDIHAVARQIAPETFQRFDALAQRKEVFRRWIGELQETRDAQVERDAPHGDEIADLQSRLETATPRLQKKYSARLEQLQTERNDYIDQHTQGDSPDMARIRQRLMETDFAMRDLAPEVGQAYRAAQEQMPQAEPASQAATELAPEVKAATSEQPVPQPAIAEPENTNVSPVEQTPVEAELPVAPPEAVAKPQVTSFNDVRHISQDVAEKLIAAGRPADEAEAAAKLIASHYWARAARFNGAKGTGLDLYRAEAPEIKAGRSKAKKSLELAQKQGRELNQARPDIISPDIEREMVARYNDELPSIEEQFTRFAGAGKSYEEIGPKQAEEIYGDSEDWPAQLRDIIAKHGNAVQVIESENSHLQWFAPGEAPSRDAFMHDAVTREGGLLPARDLDDIMDGLRTRVDGAEPAASNALAVLGESLGWKVRGHRGSRYFQFVRKLKDGEISPFDTSAEPGDDVYLQVRVSDHPNLSRHPDSPGTVPDINLAPGAHNFADAQRILSEAIETNSREFEQSRPSEPDHSEWARRFIDWSTRHAFGYDTVSARAVREHMHTNNPLVIAAAEKVADLQGLVNQYTGSLEYKETPEELQRALNDARSNLRKTERAAKNAIKEYGQSTRTGKISIFADARNTVTLFKDADASTFIHETGHQWLEEMMGDANDEAAPDDLVKDAQTVRDWLGVKDGEEIPRKAHEKFARGFETYMMEGRAPSAGLARVFEQFRQWLTSIYQTVAKLRSPINDDIRDVFDRLIVAKPERAVIAPEREVAKDFADLHEADVGSTPPHEAYDAASRIRQEADRIVREKDPEVADELNAADTGSGSAASGNAQPNAEAASDVHAPGPAGGAAGVVEEPGTVIAGGNEAPGEGAGVREEPGAASQQPRPVAQSGEAPTEPQQRFAERNPELIDKAGNIRLDKLRGPEGFDQAIREAAERNNNFLTERRGTISDGMVLELADALGTDPSFLDRKKIGEAFSEEEIIASKRLLVQSATAVREAMSAAATGADAEVMALAEAIARHEMIQGKVAQATAEWGRAGRALNMVISGSKEAQDLSAFLKENTGRDLYQLRKMAQHGQGLTTPAQVSKFVHDTANGRLKRAVIYYYVNALISGPVTHTRYAIGNAINAVWTPIFEIPAAATVGAFKQHVLGSEADRVYFGESAAQLYGMMRGSSEGLRAAIEAWKTGNSPPLPTEKIPAQFVDHSVSPITGPIGTAIGVPGRSVAAIHSFFKSLRYEQNIQGMAYRQAMKEGLSGDALVNRVAQLTESPTDDMMGSATKDALKELFMSPTDYHSPMGALTRFTNQSLAAKIIVPFMKIGTQITRNAFMERTPLGLASKDVRANVFGAHGGAAADMQIGKIVTGMALVGASVELAANGMLTGDGPEDPGQRAVWLLNHRPNHITIGDVSVPFQGLGPLGMLMRFSANAYETASHWGEEDGGKLAVAFFEGFSKSVLDENFLRGLKDLLDAVYHPQEYGGQYVQNFVTNWLPFSIGSAQVARQIDPYMRDTHANNVIDGIFKTARAHTPFLSEGLYPRVDMFGKPIPSSGNLPQYATDRTVQTLENLGVGIGRLERKIRGVPLTDKQYFDFATMAGQMMKQRLDMVVNIPGFAVLPRGRQISLIQDQMKDARESARSLIMMQNPEIWQQATATKQSILVNGPPRH